MRGARLAVVSYPDTPFIEAMLIGVPTIGLWDPQLWGMRNDAAPHFERLERLGVIHSDPERCAAKVREVYESADAWWGSPEIAAARAAFLERFAVAGDWRGDWAATLRELLSPQRVLESQAEPELTP
jgi:putative transferase (TIGR04331 family)